MLSSARARLAGLAIAGFTLGGCVTAQYGPIGTEGSPYGYHDLQNADGSYTVLVVSMTPAQAHEYWDRRAAELCGHTNFRKNIFRAEIPIVTQTGYVSGPTGYGGSYTQDAYGNLIMEGYLHCENGAEAAEAAPAAESPETPATDTASGETQQTQP